MTLFYFYYTLLSKEIFPLLQLVYTFSGLCFCFEWFVPIVKVIALKLLDDKRFLFWPQKPLSFIPSSRPPHPPWLYNTWIVTVLELLTFVLAHMTRISSLSTMNSHCLSVVEDTAMLCRTTRIPADSCQLPWLPKVQARSNYCTNCTPPTHTAQQMCVGRCTESYSWFVISPLPLSWLI